MRGGMRASVLAGVVATLAAAAAAAAAWAGPGAAGALAGPVRVEVGLAFDAPAAAGFWVAEDQGLFAKYGLDVRITRIQGSTQGMQALLAGQVDVLLGSPAQGIAVAASGTDVRSIATLGPKMPYVLAARPEVASPQDLKGKRLGVSAAGLSTDRVALLIVLDHFGLDPQRDGIVFVNAGGQSQRVAALVAGSIHATVLDPLRAAAVVARGMRVLADLAELGVPWDHDVVLVTGRTAQNRREMLDRLLRALVEANAFILNPANAEAVKRSLARGLALTEARQIDEAYDLTVRLYVVRKPYPQMEAARALVNALRNDFPELARADLNRHIDPSFLEALDKSGFIDSLR